MKMIIDVIKNVFLSRDGLFSIALIVGGIFAAELAATKISDPTGADIVSFALLMVSILGTSNLVHQIAMYNRAKEEEKQNENNK